MRDRTMNTQVTLSTSATSVATAATPFCAKFRRRRSLGREPSEVRPFQSRHGSIIASR